MASYKRGSEKCWNIILLSSFLVQRRQKCAWREVFIIPINSHFSFNLYFHLHGTENRVRVFLTGSTISSFLPFFYPRLRVWTNTLRLVVKPSWCAMYWVDYSKPTVWFEDNEVNFLTNVTSILITLSSQAAFLVTLYFPPAVFPRSLNTDFTTIKKCSRQLSS